MRALNTARQQKEENRRIPRRSVERPRKADA